MTSGEHSSSPRPIARKLEVMRFAHKISRGERGNAEFPSLSLNARPIKSRITWEMLEMSKWRRN